MSFAISRDGIPGHQCPGRRPDHAWTLCGTLRGVLQSPRLLISDPVLKELEGILPDKLAQSASITEGFINLLRSEGFLITNDHPVPSLPDPDDEPIVASALAGGAKAFVTGDKALLKLKTIEQLPIISPREFWERLSAGE